MDVLGLILYPETFPFKTEAFLDRIHPGSDVSLLLPGSLFVDHGIQQDRVMMGGSCNRTHGIDGWQSFRD